MQQKRTLRGAIDGPASRCPEERDAGQRSPGVGDSEHRQGAGGTGRGRGRPGAYPGPRAGPPHCSTGPPAGGSARSGPPAGPCHRTPPGTGPAAPPSSRGPGRQEQRVGARQRPQTPPRTPCSVPDAPGSETQQLGDARGPRLGGRPAGQPRASGGSGRRHSVTQLLSLENSRRRETPASDRACSVRGKTESHLADIQLSGP